MTDRPVAPGDPLAQHSLTPRELTELLAAERDGTPFLAFKDDDDRLRLFRAAVLGRSLTIGRRAETDLPIAWDEEVSGVHAELLGIAGEWTVVDDGLSTNGTFVNGQRVTGRQRLRDGDRVRVGHTILAYRAGGSATVPSTAAAGGTPSFEPTALQRKVLVALCRPFRDGSRFPSPATNQQIADEVYLSVDAVKMHLRTLFAKFQLAELPQNEKRARLAECALQYGVISRRELG